MGRAEWLGSCGASATPEAKTYFNDVFDALADADDERADGAELCVAASLLSGARKSEKLARAFDVLGEDGDAGALGVEGVARLLRAALCAVGYASHDAEHGALARAAGREAAALADDVVSRGSRVPNAATFDDFGGWRDERAGISLFGPGFATYFSREQPNAAKLSRNGARRGESRRRRGCRVWMFRGGGSRRRRGCRVDVPRRRVAADAAWIFRGGAASPRVPRGYSAEARRRRGCRVDIPRRRVAATPWIFRGGESRRQRGRRAG